MLVYLRLLKESFRFALNALRNNKLRTLLSLLGVTIGIFSIIAVLAAVDSLDRKIKKDLSSLDKNTIYLMRFSFGPSEIPQWKREQFPNVKYDEYEYLKGSINDVNQMAFQFFLHCMKFATRKKVFLFVFCTCLKGYDGWQSICLSVYRSSLANSTLRLLRPILSEPAVTAASAAGRSANLTRAKPLIVPKYGEETSMFFGI